MENNPAEDGYSIVIDFLKSPKTNYILKSTGQPIPLQVHIIKKMFDGVLVSAEIKTPH